MIVPRMSAATIASTLASISDCRKLRVCTSSSRVFRSYVTSRKDNSTAPSVPDSGANDPLMTISAPFLWTIFTSTSCG